MNDDYYGNRNNIFPFSVRQIHARIAIPINAIPPPEYANVIQSQNALGKRNTASIRYQKGLRKKASLRGLRIMTGSRHVGWVYLLFFSTHIYWIKFGYPECFYYFQIYYLQCGPASSSDIKGYVCTKTGDKTCVQGTCDGSKERCCSSGASKNSLTCGTSAASCGS